MTDLGGALPGVTGGGWRMPTEVSFQVAKSMKICRFAILCGSIWFTAVMSCLGDDLQALLGLPKARNGHAVGSLVIDGGPFPTDPVADRFVSLAGGKNARILVITTAKRRSPGQAMRRYRWWANLAERNEVEQVLLWSPAWESETRNAEALEFLANATGVWMTGGDQARLEKWLVDEGYSERIRNVYRRGGVVGGTSAGTAILSRPAILGGTADDISLGSGLGLLTRAVCEQHLDRQGRLLRLLTVVQKTQERPIGIAVQEWSALVLGPRRMETIDEFSDARETPEEERKRTVFLFPLPAGGYVADSLVAGDSAELQFTADSGFRLDR